MRVYIVGQDARISEMFRAYGHKLTQDFQEADLVQFTGGADVTPGLYAHRKHPLTENDIRRDFSERHVFFRALHQRIPMAGICRGGQFLNVMCGGYMEQHVNNHTGSHVARVLGGDEREVQVTSTHHQMIRPTAAALVLLVADICTHAENTLNGATTIYNPREINMPDIESCFYFQQRVLCFQPHPEYVRPHTELPDLYFEFLQLHLGFRSE